MFSAAHFSNEKIQASSPAYPSFAMHGLNMNVNVTMSPVYATNNHSSMPQSSSPITTKGFYSSDENGTNPLEGNYSLYTSRCFALWATLAFLLLKQTS